MEKRDNFLELLPDKIGTSGKILEQGFQKYPCGRKEGRTGEIWTKNSNDLSQLLLAFLAHQLRDRGNDFQASLFDGLLVGLS